MGTYGRQRKKRYRVGDRVVGSHGVLKIIRRVRKRDFEGETQEYFVLKPCYTKNSQSKSHTVLIPIENIEKTGKRRLLSKNKLRGYLRDLHKMRLQRRKPSNQDIKNVIMMNNAEKIFGIAKHLDLSRKAGELPFSKNQLYDMAIRVLTEETAAVEGISFERATAKIERAMNK